jgi:hypothetical protein
LFDALADGRWRTSEETAAVAGLNERYVREWLSAMVAGRVVEADDTGRFRLPHEHAALVSRSGDENLAVYAQYFPVMAGVEEDLLHCFREGGGVPYERFGRFHEVMEEEVFRTSGSAVFTK